MNRQQNPQRFDSRLIQKPRQQPRLQRTAWGFVTLAFWGFYFYLWAPLVTLFSWLLGGHMAWLQLYEHEQQIDTFVLVALPLMLVLCAALLIAWAEYNRARFAGNDRRAPRGIVERGEIARGLGASDALAQQLAGAKAVTLRMDDNARPTAVTPQLLVAPVTRA